jgi:hypothetical protein
VSLMSFCWLDVLQTVFYGLCFLLFVVLGVKFIHDSFRDSSQMKKLYIQYYLQFSVL